MRYLYLRQTVIGLVALLWAGPAAAATIQACHMMYPRSSLDNSATEYQTFCNGSGGWEAANNFSVVASVFTAEHLRIEIEAAPDNGAGVQSFTFTVQTQTTGNADGTWNDTSCSCVVQETDTTCEDETCSFTTALGDVLRMEVVPANTPSTDQVTGQLKVTYAADDTFTYFAGGESTMTTGTDYYHGLIASTQRDTVQNEKFIMVAADGTVSDLYVELHVAPGSGQSRVFTIQDCGAYTGAASCSNSIVACTISNTDETCSDTDAGFAVTAGDILVLFDDASASAVSPEGLGIGWKFVPDTTGQTSVFFASDSNPCEGTCYVSIDTSDDSYTSTEAEYQRMAGKWQVEALFVWQESEVGSGETNAYTLMKNGSAETGCSCTMSGAGDNECTDSDCGPVLLDVGDRISTRQVGSVGMTTAVESSVSYRMGTTNLRRRGLQ